MPTYAIGDIQGCFDELQDLLQVINFSPNQDRLWITGDLINRGPKSLETLRFLANLNPAPEIVLGNHDLHFLACVNGATSIRSSDTFDELLNAPDLDELCHWLQHQKMLHHDASLGFTMTHAGLCPTWDLNQAQTLANEVENALRGKDCATFLTEMYGNKPSQWDDALTGWPRLRLITNYLTRMRFCTATGELFLKEKGSPPPSNPNLMPWFDVPHRANANLDILFGHWAALNGECDVKHVHALDTGCVWGGKLTAMCLEDLKRSSVTSHC